MMKGKEFAAPSLTARATLTSLTQEVLEMIVNHLHGNDKSHLALCCKATLPILCMGHVRLRTDEHKSDKHARQRPLLKATRCLAKQPDGVSHLEVSSRDVYAYLDARHLVDLSLLLHLRKLSLDTIAVSLPALQPVATGLRELSVSGSRLQGSADGFLTKGWTALTSLSLFNTRMDKAMLTAALKLPALEDVHICSFTGYRGGELQLDQLTGSCPQISRLAFRLSKREATEASRLLNLKRLADLHIMSWSFHANLDLDLPPSLTQLKFGGSWMDGSSSFDFFWALQEAVKCVGRGAQLHKLTCDCTGYLEPAQWGASLDEQHRRLGRQLGSLRELEVVCHEHLLCAVGAVASAATSLVRLEIVITSGFPSVEVSPICSASLESIRLEWGRDIWDEVPPLQVLLTLLPGCTRLQEVVVRFPGPPVEGAAVKIHCHCCSQRCIVPEDLIAGDHSDVIVNLLHMPSSEQAVQECTVLCTCHAAGPEQAPLWGHTVMAGIL